MTKEEAKKRLKEMREFNIKIKDSFISQLDAKWDEYCMAVRNVGVVILDEKETSEEQLEHYGLHQWRMNIGNGCGDDE